MATSPVMKGPPGLNGGIGEGEALSRQGHLVLVDQIDAHRHRIGPSARLRVMTCFLSGVGMTHVLLDEMRPHLPGCC